MQTTLKFTVEELLAFGVADCSIDIAVTYNLEAGEPRTHDYPGSAPSAELHFWQITKVECYGIAGEPLPARAWGFTEEEISQSDDIVKQLKQFIDGITQEEIMEHAAEEEQGLYDMEMEARLDGMRNGDFD